MTSLRGLLKKFKRPYFHIYYTFFTFAGKILNPIALLKNSFKSNRKLEIGPGEKRIQGFETLNVVGGLNVDYVYDASRKLPFRDGTFDVVYASHILEHIPWYMTKSVLAEWVRILKPSGALEIWVPDGYKICSSVVSAEQGLETEMSKDGWYRFNEHKDPYLWANGRLFTYGDGTGNVNHHNWHRAMFTPKNLIDLMERTSLENVEKMSENEVRGYSHGWFGLGVRGTKQK